MKLLAFDPSGNHGKEGYGNTGVCIMEDGEVKKLDVISAKDFQSETEYWAAHEDYIQKEWPDHMVFEGYRLYNHKGMAAKSQANSDLPTPQLIGILKMACWNIDIPYTIQYAADVKTRWSEDVLVQLGILEKKVTGRGTSYYWNGQLTMTHTRDALKHALHWTRYKESKL
jgi:hypothetical protein